MTRKAVLAASAVAGALVLTASTAGVAAAAHTPVIVDHQNLKNLDVVLHVDDSLALRFRECTSCGYHWAFVKKPSATLVKKTSRAQGPNNAPGVVGGAGTHTFTFTGLKAGKTTAQLGYYPPGAHSEPARVVTVTLKVAS